MKLVRNFIPQVIKEAGKDCRYHVATLEEIKELLYEKMIEEMQEFKEDPSIEEAADMLEVLKTIFWAHCIDIEAVKVAAEKKRKARGGFWEGIVLEEVINE